MLKLNDYPHKLKPYIFHGLEVDPTGKNGTCPFCEGVKKFRVELEGGRFRCVVCEKKGNIYNFIKLIYDLSETSIDSLNRLTKEDYFKKKSITPEGLQHFGVKISFLSGEPIFPVYNHKKAFSNLYKLVKLIRKTKGTNKQEIIYKCWGTPSLKPHLFNTQNLTKQQSIRWIVEGFSDCVRLQQELLTHKIQAGKIQHDSTISSKESMLASQGVIGLPGVSSFTEADTSYLYGKKVILCLDNDHPRKIQKTGETIQPAKLGFEKIAQILAATSTDTKKIFYVHWGANYHTKDLPSGYDLTDYINQNNLPLKSITKKIKSFSSKVQTKAKEVGEQVSTVEPIAMSSFKEVCKEFVDSGMEFHRPYKDTLAILYATTISVTLPGDQIFLRVIGSGGSGKTTLVEMFSVAKEYTYAASIQKGFHSGWKGSGKEKKIDLLDLMNHKTVFVKDVDTLLSNPSRDKILGELRDVFDGKSRAIYLNNESSIHEDLHINYVFCGTDRIRQLNRSSLGERFLDCDIVEDTDTRKIIEKSVLSTYKRVASGFKQIENSSVPAEFQKHLERVVYGYLLSLKETMKETDPPTLNQKYESVLMDLGEVVAYLRAEVDRDPNHHYKNRKEIATRPVNQLTKLSICLAYILNKKAVDKECIRLCRKVARDSSEGIKHDIVRILYRNPEGLSVQQLEFKLNLAEITIRRILEEMRSLKIIERNEEVVRNQRGRKRHLFKLSYTFHSLYKKAFYS